MKTWKGKNPELTVILGCCHFISFSVNLLDADLAV